MAKFCTECGKEIRDGIAFCTECGTKAPAEPEINAIQPASEAEQPEQPPVATPAASIQPQQPPVVVPVAPVQPQQAPVAAAVAVQTSPIPQPVMAPVASDPTNKTVSTAAYFWLMLLFAIPVIGWLICLIMAFAPKNKNLKHFARAILIWGLVAAVLIGILTALIALLSNTIMDYISQITDGQINNFGELFGQFGDLKGLLEQLNPEGAV